MNSRSVNFSFSLSINLSTILSNNQLVVWLKKKKKMSENGGKCLSVFIKAKEDVLECLVVSVTQRYSVHCHSG